MITPQKLSPGDEIRIITPSSSWARVGGFEANLKSKEKLESWGLKVTFGRHIETSDIQDSLPIQDRVDDIHEAFADPNIKAILSLIGGFTSNELLPYLDYELIRNNPKIICGFSDFTALANAITAKTGLVTYYGPAYVTLKMSDEQGQYQDDCFKKVLFGSEATKLVASKTWSSDAWYDPTASRNYHDNQWQVYSEGHIKGQTVGGNLDTFNLLAGTPYQPELDDKVWFFEFSEEMHGIELSRYLAQLLQISQKPKALLLGRFPKENKMTKELLHYILDKFPIFKQLPVIYDVNFGHAQPILTLPLGGLVEIETKTKSITTL
ncbi:LD-carboxypeptidase [Holzapfeliella sp. He02]|uniref:LD-carboxypeptidase n=1 Tax=Holzapfeliella saturejae TaxID=3082953 RepID=A0ABU8SHZ8_9LACO